MLILMIISFILMLIGIAFVMIFYFDLLYTLNENRIIEFADPLISKFTMLVVIFLAIDGFFIFICTIIYFLTKKNPEKNFSVLKTVCLMTGYGALCIFPIGTFFGVEILSFLYLKVPNVNDFKMDNDEKIKGKLSRHPNPPNSPNPIANLLISAAFYRIVVAIMLFSIYHVLFVIPYEHLGSELAPTIRFVWDFALAINVVWLISGLYSLFLFLLSRKNSRILNEKPLLRRIFLILNLIFIPIGTMIAINLNKLVMGNSES